MNEQRIAYRIRQHLNRGLDLDPDKLARLKRARERALARQPLEHHVALWASADNVLGRPDSSSSILSRLLLPMAVLILGLVVINHWRDFQLAAEIEAIDAAVLAGDLPLDAYLDKGFNAWLKRPSQ